MVELWKPCDMIQKFLESQLSAFEEQALAENTSIITSYKKILKLIHELETYLNSAEVWLNEESDANSSFPKGPTLTKEMKERKFDPLRAPKDEKSKNCVYCGHPTVNYPEENEGVRDYNKKIMEMNTKRWKVWSQYLEKQASGRNVPKPIDPLDKSGKKIMERKPCPKEYKTLMMQCMCSTSKCLQVGSDCGSTCPIKCIDSATGLRYKTDPETGLCTCKVCTCKCCRLYNINSIPSISFQVNKKKALQELQNGETFNINANTNPIQYASFFYGTIQDAFEKTTQETAEELSLKASATEKQKQQIITNKKRQAFHDAASTIAATGHVYMSAKEKAELMEDYGNETRVELCGGDVVDTRFMGSPEGKHAYSNNLINASALSSNTNEPVIQRGMINNLYIDHSKPYTEAYKKAFNEKAIAMAQVEFNNNLITPPMTRYLTPPVIAIDTPEKQNLAELIDLCADNNCNNKSTSTSSLTTTLKKPYEPPYTTAFKKVFNVAKKKMRIGEKITDKKEKKKQDSYVAMVTDMQEKQKTGEFQDRLDIVCNESTDFEDPDSYNAEELFKRYRSIYHRDLESFDEE